MARSTATVKEGDFRVTRRDKGFFDLGQPGKETRSRSWLALSLIIVRSSFISSLHTRITDGRPDAMGRKKRRFYVFLLSPFSTPLRKGAPVFSNAAHAMPWPSSAPRTVRYTLSGREKEKGGEGREGREGGRKRKRDA